MTFQVEDELKEQVLAAIDADGLVSLASAICDVHSPTGQEAEVAQLLQGLMQERGMRALLQEVEPGRPNVIGVLPGQGGGRTLMFNGHMDTSFPFLLGGSRRAGLMERPLPSHVLGEWLYATGVDNMKAAFACYLGAVEALGRAGVLLAGDVLITGVVGEIEASPVDRYQGAGYRGHGHGTRHLIGHGALADWCILGEPTNLRVGLGNCGTVWARVTARGPVMGSYVSSWESNAIYRTIQLIELLQEWRTGYIERYRHSEVAPSVTISAIEGGWPWRAARTPGECSVYIDVRTAPNQPLITVRDELMELIRRFDAGDSTYPTDIEFYATIPGFELERESPLAQAMRRAHIAANDQEPDYRFSAAVDDGAHLSRYGIPTVVYGPGGARREDGEGPLTEYVRIQNLVDCTRAYAFAALELCNLPVESRLAEV